MTKSKRTAASAVPRSDQDALRALCVGPTATLMQGLEVINRGAVELAFVTDRALRVLGTFSDGDARRAILSGVPLDRPGAVGEAMRKKFVSVGRRAQRSDALDVMRARSITQIPVLDDRGRLIGLHLLRDLLGATARPNRAVILAGGRGTRLRPHTENVPKPMLQVAGRPILERLVLHLVGYGIREIYLSINYLGSMVEAHFGDGSAFGCAIHYLRETRELGTGGPLSLLPRPRTAAGQAPVLVMNGDLVTQANIDDILGFHEQSGCVVTACVRPYALKIPYGVAEVRRDRLVALREKPTVQSLINAGIYVLSPPALAMIPKNQEYPITRLLETCLEKDIPVGAHTLDGDWIDIGQPEELRKAGGAQ